MSEPSRAGALKGANVTKRTRDVRRKKENTRVRDHASVLVVLEFGDDEVK